MADEVKKDENLTVEPQEDVLEEEQQGENSENEEAAEEKVPETPSVEELQQKLIEKEAQAEDYYNRMLRIQADFENFRRRSRQEREELLKYAGEEVIKKLLPVLDNFERALASAANPGDDFVSGVEMIFRQLQEILNKEGLEVIPSRGEQFDPNKHEAVMQVESEEHDENIIVEELCRGYMLKGKVIRPAMVKVAK
ncbi:molecular chaperone GrpE [Desulfohalotomaculum tongense]|uniref:nucleotide exchange factor GrpE n=1 Tax=Desulforadius tongensis TaxID=1216062 RepID=UPI00195C16E2|nr:nucleotide exchange factor GrpE [Desulforadius tongensis]MBM7855708.1 molecular chaperone GrpE [Desulforadius tongensis]